MKQMNERLKEMVSHDRSTTGKTRFQMLPPLRDGKVINLKALCSVINLFTPENTVELMADGIILNGVQVQINYGLVTAKNAKWRFRFLEEFLHNLRKEHLFYGTDKQIEEMGLYYKKLCPNR